MSTADVTPIADAAKNAVDLVDSRDIVYGPIVESFTRIAQTWSGILGVPVEAHQVALCMQGLKLVRANYSPDYEDNIKDAEGYAYVFRRIMGDSMISAATPRDYLMQKNNAAPRD